MTDVLTKLLVLAALAGAVYAEQQFLLGGFAEVFHTAVMEVSR